MNKDELHKKVKLFEIKSKRHIQQLLAGAYHSVFKGKGIEFCDVKEYSFEDDIKDIDWNVTARAGSTYVKNYVEERELQLVIAVDLSASQNFGSQTQLKQDLAVELGALLSFSALNNRDRVGLLLFSDEIEKYIPPKKGRVHVLRLVRDLIHFQAKSPKTDLSNALNFLLKTIKKKAIVFLISDFIDQKDFTRPAVMLGKKHDLVAIRITDPFEELPPSIGYIHLQDSETGEERIFNLKRKGFREDYLRYLRENDQKLKAVFKKGKIDFLQFETNVPYTAQLTHFFRKRAQRY